VLPRNPLSRRRAGRVAVSGAILTANNNPGDTVMKRALFAVATLLCLGTVANAQATLQVLDYGAEPRSTLRYQFKPGQSERATMEMSINATMEMNGRKMPSTLMPPVKATMSMRVTEVAPDGSARLEFKTQSAEAPVDQVAGQAGQALLTRTLAGLTLVSGSYRTDTRGRVLESSVSLPEGYVPAEAAQTMNQLMGQGNETLQQFPDEAVGPGARWQVVHKLELAGVAITMGQEYTLQSRNGNRIELAVRSVTPAVAAGAPAAAGTLAAVSPTTAGTLLIDLNKLVPTISVQGGTDSTMTLPGQGEPQVMKMSSQMRMSVMPATE
jgi:hypothetical protein